MPFSAKLKSTKFPVLFGGCSHFVMAQIALWSRKMQFFTEKSKSVTVDWFWYICHCQLLFHPKVHVECLLKLKSDVYWMKIVGFVDNWNLITADDEKLLFIYFSSILHPFFWVIWQNFGKFDSWYFFKSSFAHISQLLGRNKKLKSIFRIEKHKCNERFDWSIEKATLWGTITLKKFPVSLSLH